MAQNSTQSLEEEVKSLVEKALSLVAATEGLSDSRVAEARARLKADLDKYQPTYGSWRERVAANLKTVDKSIKEHPYQSLGIALGVGAILGLVLGGTRSSD